MKRQFQEIASRVARRFRSLMARVKWWYVAGSISLVVLGWGGQFGFDLLARSIEDDLTRPTLIFCAPLQEARISLVDGDSVVGTALYPVDNYSFLRLINDTGRRLSNVKVFARFSGFDGRVPHVSKMQVMSTSLSGSEEATATLRSGVLTIEVPVMPPDAELFMDVLFWEPIDALIEVNYNEEAWTERAPSGCPFDEATFTLMALESFFEYADKSCVQNGRLLECNPPQMTEPIGAVEQGSTIVLQFTIKFQNEFFGPEDPEIAFRKNTTLYNENLIPQAEN